jgi:hypothetical protein
MGGGGSRVTNNGVVVGIRQNNKQKAGDVGQWLLLFMILCGTGCGIKHLIVLILRDRRVPRTADWKQI